MKTILSSLRRYTFTALFTLTLMVCTAVNVLAATYYISPSGDDSNDGSIGSPWKTLLHATQTVLTPGDIIHVKPGTYLETAQCYLSEGVSLEGEGVTSIIQTTLTENFRELLTLRSPQGTNGNQFIRNLKFDGQDLSTYWAIWIGGRSNVSIYDCIFDNFKDRGIIFSGRNDFIDTLPDVYATGNKFYNNSVSNCAAYHDTTTGTYGRGCLNIGGQDGMLIYNNVITQNQRPEGYNGWPIKYMNHGYLKNCKIYNNTLTKIPYGGVFPGESGWDFCIELFNIEGLEIYGNTIQGSIDLNFSRKGSSDYSAWIHNNLISRDTLNGKYESGIIFEFGAETAIVESNILKNISSGIQFNTRDSSLISNCIIRKNLIANTASGEGIGTAGGIMVISEGTSSAMISNLEIDNNTITATSLPNRAPWVGIHFDALSFGFATNVKIRNNIVVGFQAAWLQGSDTTNMDQVHILINDSYLNGNNNQPSWPGGVPANYVDTPYNVPGMDPLFDSSNSNHYLQSISPVIDLGIIIPGIPFLGLGPDLGYAEFGGGGPLPINWLDFTGNENAGKNILQWATASENNSNFFNVERSNDARKFEQLGRVNATGFSQAKVNYSFIDINPPKRKNDYRLAMIDKNGKSEFSKVISILNRENQSIAIKYAELSSANSNAFFIISSSKTQAANLTITDVSGRIILNTQLQLEKGDNTITKNIPAIAKGIYYLRLVTEDQMQVKNIFSR